MKRIKLIFLFALSSQLLTAQMETYNLNDYVQGKVRLTTKQLNPGFNFNVSNDESTAFTSTSNSTSGSVGYISSLFKNDTLSYKEVRFQGSFLGSRGSRNNERSIALNPMVFYDARYNNYFKNNFFLGLDMDNFIGYDYGKVIEADPNFDIKNKLFISDQDVELSIGLGRAQLIEDPLKAIAIFKLLRQNEMLLTEVIDHSDIDELSTLLNDLRSLRNEDLSYTDTRLLRNARLDLLSQHMIDKGLVDKNNYSMFSVLYDGWRFENFFSRKVNSEFRIGVAYRHLYDWRFNTQQEFSQVFLNRGPTLFTSYEYNKALNINWHLRIDNRVELSNIFVERSSGSSFVEFNRRLESTTDWQLTYQPSIRSLFSVRASTLWIKGQQRLSEDVPFEEDFNLLFLDFNATLNYYVSPQYRLMVVYTIDTDSIDQVTQFNNRLSNSLVLQVTYYFM
jgi:hypothetical protein